MDNISDHNVVHLDKRLDIFSAQAAEDLESHRLFVREMNSQHQRVYAYGGLSALVLSMLIVAVAFIFGLLAKVWVWGLALSVFLIALVFVRGRAQISSKAGQAQVLQYCEINQIELKMLIEYYRHDGHYTFFTALFDDELLPEPNTQQDAFLEGE